MTAGQDEARAPDYVIDGMCMTWRHDFGLVKPEGRQDMSSGMTERERDSLRRQMRQIWEHNIGPYIASALSEARDQGAREMRDGLAAWMHEQAANLRLNAPKKAAEFEAFAFILAGTLLPSQKGTAPSVAPNPHPDELTALSQEMGLYDTPGTAALREAVVTALSKGFMTASAEYGAYFIEIKFKSMADMNACHSALIGMALADRAALSSAQGSTTEGRK